MPLLQKESIENCANSVTLGLCASPILPFLDPWNWAEIPDLYYLTPDLSLPNRQFPEFLHIKLEPIPLSQVHLIPASQNRHKQLNWNHRSLSNSIMNIDDSIDQPRIKRMKCTGIFIGCTKADCILKMPPSRNANHFILLFSLVRRLATE